jgi:hypothetical protein
VINFVNASGHRGTLRHLLPALNVPTRRWSYERLVRQPRLPRGTWIFTDHERLSAFETRVAASVAQQLRQAGCKVLNHPAEVRTRFGLLDALQAAGINAFRAFRADESPVPSRFPVFIRWEYDHRGGRDLIANQADLDAALGRERAEGVPLIGRLVIEFASEEASPGIWYRGSAYRVADAIIGHHLALDDKWLVKDGFDAARLDTYAHRDEFLARERALVVDAVYSDLLRRVFDIAGIEYGRADFGFVGDRLQIYEINTNPSHGAAADVFGNIHPGREQTQRFSEQRLHEALEAISSDDAGSVPISGPLLASQRRLFPLLPTMMRRP